MVKRKYNRITNPTTVAVKKRKVMKKKMKASIRRVTPGFPTSRLVRMRYVENFNLTCTLGAMGHYRFRANSVFDPNQTGVGHQAIGFDQWSAFYKRFMVLGSKIIVQLGGQGDAETLQTTSYVGVKVDSDTTSSNDYNEIMEQGGNRWKLIQLKGDKSYTIRRNFSTKKHFHLANIKDNMADYGHTSSANPNEQAFYDVWLQPFDKITGLVTNAVAIIDYIVLCSEPTDLPQS